MSGGPGAPGTSLPNGSEVGARAVTHLWAVGRIPRPSGGEAAAAARRYCAEVLGSLGLRVAERPFEYSAAVGELGTPSAGVAMLALVAGAAALSLGKEPGAGAILLILGLLLVVLAGGWMARRGVLSLRFRKRRGVNLEALPTSGAVHVWLVAHIDSKSQPISLVVRAAGIVLLLVSYIAALLLAGAGTHGVEVRRHWWLYVLIAAALGAAPVIASVVGAGSPGAVDNASGVATVLAAAELSIGAPIGILITDAEELGLAGARAWCASAGANRVPVLNCDGVDDVGVLTLMWTRPRAASLEQALRNAAAGVAVPIRAIPLIPGVLVDGVAFSDAGWECVTLSRGSVETLRRIHTIRDDLHRLQGTGVAAAARVLATAARELAERR